MQMTIKEFRMTPKEFYCTYGHLNCSIIDGGSCSDELETRLEQRAKDMGEQNKEGE